MTQSISIRRAFTLIELLVVIAIIAILAAILFPVFSQAKLAAKKAADLSNIKQIATGIQMYAIDADDLYPQTIGNHPSKGGWSEGDWVALPADWSSKFTAEDIEVDQTLWANSLQPYVKSYAIFESTAGKDRAVLAKSFYTAAVKPRFKSSYAMNGLLNSFPTTGVASPSKLMLFGGLRGSMKMDGAALANPAMHCFNPDEPCRFVPSSATCGFDQNGAMSGPFEEPRGYNYWMFQKGVNVAMADTSAKFRRLGQNIDGPTDYRTDWMSEYSADGSTGTIWEDSNFCHVLLFQPDFDFENFGTPVEF